MTEEQMASGDWVAEWTPIRPATCRKGGCGTPVVDSSEWCGKHRQEVAARRAQATAGVRQGVLDAIIVRHLETGTRPYSV